MLLEELRKIPEFNAFEKAVKERLTSESPYVRHFMPEIGEYCEDNGGSFKTEEQATEDGIEMLLEDKEGYLEEFVTCDVYKEVTELSRILIKEILK